MVNRSCILTLSKSIFNFISDTFYRCEWQHFEKVHSWWLVHSFFFVSKVSLLILLACNFLIISTTLAYTNEHAYLVTCRQVYKKRSTIIYLLAQEHKRLSFSISFWLYKMRFIFSWFLLVLCARFIFFSRFHLLLLSLLFSSSLPSSARGTQYKVFY